MSEVRSWWTDWWRNGNLFVSMLVIKLGVRKGSVGGNLVGITGGDAYVAALGQEDAM